MNQHSNFTYSQSIGGYWGERRVMRLAAVFWFIMLIGIPGGLALLHALTP